MAASLPLRLLAVVWLGLVVGLSAAPQPSAMLSAQSTGVAAQGSWTRSKTHDGWQIGVQFVHHNGDRLAASFALPIAETDAATAEFGYTKSEAQAVVTGCKGCDQAEVDRRIVDFYRRRGFVPTFTPGFINLAIDMPEIVWRNTTRVKRVATEVERLAREHQYDASDTISAVLALAQSGIPYFSPPAQENGREILGLYVPPQVLASGRGDCDSKTGLVASVLKNFSGARLLGVSLPGHYLMGIARLPQRGDAYVEYGGETYVLVEPAGPALLPPGQVSDYSRNLMGTRHDVRLDPFR